MEQVQHFAHSDGRNAKHMLTLHNEELDHRPYISKFRCHACCQKITFPAYVCEACFYEFHEEVNPNLLPSADNQKILTMLRIGKRFMLHKSCFEFSQEIEYIHHSEHNLTLQSHILYGWKARSLICDVCEYIFHGFFYHCIQCQISICVQCVSLNRTLDWRERLVAREKKKLFHFSHIHPLRFCKSVGRVSLYELYCKVCSLPLSAESYGFDPSYGCVDCEFFIHKSCKDMPRTIMHPAHPLHPLSMLDFTYVKERGCSFCNSQEYYMDNLTFGCRKCSFQLHMKCAYSTMCTFNHECHPHAIVYQFGRRFPEAKYYRHGKISRICCNICFLYIRTYKAEEDLHIYTCVECDLYFHFKCVMIPLRVKHKCHVHSLILTNELVEDEYGVYYCDICETQRNPKHYRYFCEECCFVAHIHCTLNKEGTSSNMSFSLIPYIEDMKNMKQQGIELPEGNQESSLTYVTQIDHPIDLHPLYLCNEIDEVTNTRNCKLCGCRISTPAYSCMKCQVWVHKSCTELPSQIKEHCLHKNCDRPLTLDYPAIRKLFDMVMCQNCRTISGISMYTCGNCNLALDTNCAFLTEDEIKGTFIEGEETHNIIHKHTLVSTNFKDVKYRCDICYTWLIGQSYSCLKCEVHYHKSCLKYSNEHWHQSSDSMHPLQIVHRSNSRYKVCHACGLFIEGFHCWCNICSIALHAKCADYLVHNLRGEIHNHIYMYSRDDYLHQLDADEFLCSPDNYFHHLEMYYSRFKCHICSKNCKDSFYRCGKCKTNAHSKCLNLPRIVKHKCHWHPLILMDYLPEDDSGEYYCNVCEMERHPKLPVYYCEECLFEAHIQCILQENRTTKSRFNLIENEDAEQKKTFIILDENGIEIKEEDDDIVQEDALKKYFGRVCDGKSKATLKLRG